MIALAPVQHRARAGFTLIELITASILLALFAGATASAVIKAVRSRDDAAARREAFARAEVAVTRIAADVLSAARDPNLQFARVRIDDGGVPPQAQDALLVLSRSLTSVRDDGDVNEAGTREVQYRLLSTEIGAGMQSSAGTPAPGGMTLWRRADPTPDRAYDAGGVVSPVCDGIVSLSIEALDTETWVASWDSDESGYPHAVRVTVTAVSDINSRVTATLRRTVALDRTPRPAAEADDSAQAAQDSDTSSQNGTNTGTSTGGTGGGATNPGGGGGGGRGGGGNGNGGGGRPGTGGGGAGNGNGGGGRGNGNGGNGGGGGGRGGDGSGGGGGGQGGRG